MAVGIKGFKINLYSPTFRESFLNDIKENYVPINGRSQDSLIGAKMNGNPGHSLRGTYSGFLQAGFMLKKKRHPSFSFYMGIEEFLLHDDSFRYYEDPKYGDIDYVGMATIFYELKGGCQIIPDGPFYFNIGYKWVNYDGLQFKNTPLSAYTNGYIENKYNKSGKITLSISIMLTQFTY